MLTVIGAMPSVCTGIAATAVALACTETVLIPSTFEKKPVADFVCLTVIMSFGSHLLPIVIVAPSTPPFFVANGVCECGRLTGVRRQFLRAGECSCVDGRLADPLLAEPEPTSRHERDHRDEEDHEDGGHHGHLTVCSSGSCGHSRRSLVVLVRLPALTVQPRMLTVYG